MGGFLYAYLRPRRFFLREVDFRADFLRVVFLFAVFRRAFFRFLAGIGTTSSHKRAQCARAMNCFPSNKHFIHIKYVVSISQ